MTRHDLDVFLRRTVTLGALLVLLVPAARGSHALLGWLPLWLVGMPLASWWSLRGCPLPRPVLRLPRRVRPQARRRGVRRGGAARREAHRA